MAPALGFLILDIMDWMFSGEWVSETVMPSSLIGSGSSYDAILK